MTIGQVREMMTTSMISEGEDIVSKMDDGGRTSHNGLGSLAMLHHECRRMAAHVGNAGEKSSTLEDRPEKATLRQVDRMTHEGKQTLEGDVWRTVFFTWSRHHRLPLCLCACPKSSGIRL